MSLTTSSHVPSASRVKGVTDVLTMLRRLRPMHHKRRRPKHQRAGCLLCKPHKDEREPKLIRVKGLRAPRSLRRADGASADAD
jgi:hypothetical protein